MYGAKYAMAMLAAGGAVGAASQVSAATTVTLNIPFSQQLTPITLVGSSPQFAYGIPGLGALETDFDAYGGARIHSTPYATDPGLPTAGETYDTQSVKTAGFACGIPCSYGYFHLKFKDAGSGYVGTAYVDADATLETITFDQAAFAVPEPDAWALLIAGLGMTGAVMRRNRRRSQAAMA